jgi:hypothetical protein
MSSLQITKIKPNPVGKDRSSTGVTPASQLAGEWVDFKNTGASAVKLDGVDLYHLAYAAGSAQGRWDKVTGFTGTLPAGQTVRVHSGSGPLSVIRPEDFAGADHHVFTNRDYVWNNKQGDSPTLFDSSRNQNIDQASYDPYPPEGQVLVRSGNKLVPVGVPAYAR